MSVEKQECGHSSFISPFWDFVFVGGLTFLFFPILIILQFDIRVVLSVSVAMYAVSFFINNPHFMYSYQILYSGFRQKLSSQNETFSRFRYFFSGVVVPVIFVAFYAFSYYHGVQNQDASVLGYAVNVMFFLVGWHYVKQGYGVLITLSVKKRVFYTELEKKLLLYNGYITWIAAWVASNGTGVFGENAYFNIPYAAFPFSFNTEWLVLLAMLSCAASIIIFIMRVHKGSVVVNGWVGYFCALYAWTVMVVGNPLWILVVPALHSLQYLLFVGKLSFEKDRAESEQGRPSRFLSFLAIGGILGVMGFWLIPYVLDQVIPYSHEVFGTAMFMMMFIVFINVHHYFIDFAIWRKDNPEMKYLYN